MTRDNPLAVLVQHNLARSVMQILDHDPGVRRGDDPEEVHQFRVGIRRIRSDLHTFKPLFMNAPRKELSGELVWLGSIVGAVRDDDVLAQRLRKNSMKLPKADAAGVQDLFAHLGRQQATNRSTLLTALADPRYLGVLDALIKFAIKPPVRRNGTKDTHGEVALVGAKFVRKPWQRLAKAVAELEDDAPDSALHHIRILAKRCRYAAEAVAPVIEDAGQFAKDLAELQTELGNHQDAVVAEAWLRDFAATVPAGALVAGELILAQRQRQRSARAEWPRVWQSISTNKPPSFF